MRIVGFTSLCASILAAQTTMGYAQDSGGPITLAELTTAGYAFPTDLVSGANQTQLANYAWRLFIAASQLTDATLASPSGRTTPSASHNFADSGYSPSFDNPLVFEGFYHRSEAYPYFSGAAPQPPINQTPVYRYQGDFTVEGGQFVNLDETNEIGQNFVYYRESNDPDFEVLYMAKVNADEVNYAWDRVAPSAMKSWEFPPIIEVKAAWRRVSDIKNSDPNDYHQATATYYSGEEGQGQPQVVTDTFALIALHIIQKTPNYPGFIFTTFEHVDAVTRNAAGDITDPAYHLTYENLAYGSSGAPVNTPQTANVTGAYTDNAPGLPPASDAAISYDLPAAGPQPGGYTVVAQPKTITSEVNDVNNNVLDLIQQAGPKSVWANYRLKGVQGVPTSDEASLDFFLANIVIESSQPGIQLFKGGVSKAELPVTFYNDRAKMNVSVGVTGGQPVPDPEFLMGGCMGCHGIAQQFGQDSSFIAQGAGQGFAPDPVAPSSISPAALLAHQNSLAVRRGSELFGK